MAVALVAIALAAGCSTRSVTLPEAGELTPPSFPERPADPGDASQLDVIAQTDQSELAPPPAADPSSLERLLPRLDEIAPGATEATRVSVYPDSVFVTLVDPANPSRTISATYAAADDRLNVFDPEALDDDPFPLAAVEPAIPAAVAAGVARRFPSLAVTSYDLRRALSYAFELVWFLELEDTSGRVARVFVDPDGEVVAVDTA